MSEAESRMRRQIHNMKARNLPDWTARAQLVEEALEALLLEQRAALDTARAEGYAAAREQAASIYDKRAARLRAEAEQTAGEKLRLERLEYAEQWESEARTIRAMQDGQGQEVVES